MASITGSTTTPFNSLLLQDATFNVSASWGASATTASTPSVNFQVANPWPTSAECIINVYTNQILNTSGSQVYGVALQESADNSSWNNIAIFFNPIVSATDASNTGSAATTQVILGPNAKQYLRAIGVTPAIINSVPPTGSFGFKTFF